MLLCQIRVCDRKVTYITNQQERHRKKTFREELVAFLRKSGVEFDERYLD